jgi:hypothetical protein
VITFEEKEGQMVVLIKVWVGGGRKGEEEGRENEKGVGKREVVKIVNAARWEKLKNLSLLVENVRTE